MRSWRICRDKWKAQSGKQFSNLHPVGARLKTKVWVNDETVRLGHTGNEISYLHSPEHLACPPARFGVTLSVFLLHYSSEIGLGLINTPAECKILIRGVLILLGMICECIFLFYLSCCLSIERLALTVLTHLHLNLGGVLQEAYQGDCFGNVEWELSLTCYLLETTTDPSPSLRGNRDLSRDDQMYLEKRCLKRKTPRKPHNFKTKPLSTPYSTHLGFKPKKNPTDIYRLIRGQLSGKSLPDFRRKQVYKQEKAWLGSKLLFPVVVS